jgi:hypothetical protein
MTEVNRFIEASSHNEGQARLLQFDCDLLDDSKKSVT